MELQQTINSRVSLKGIGLHTGEECSLALLPAPVNSGITFKRIDLKESPAIPANYSKIVDPALRPRRTSIGEGSVEVQTVEHLMAALCGLSVDNVIIEVNAQELPGLDGSAKPYVELIKKAGIVAQDAPRRPLVIKEPLWIEEGDASMAVLPSDNFKVSYTLDYKNAIVGCQYLSFSIDEDVFEQQIAPSRTFCLSSEVEELKMMGLGKGANYENTIVISDKGVVGCNLRFENELVRHKISDLIGDLYLLGAPIKGHVVALKSGHSLNIKMLQRLGLYAARQSNAGVSPPSKEKTGGLPFGIDEIKKILPHREPFLLIDEIVELESNKAVGLKYVSLDEYYFPGHFPGKPVMPGVLIMEALAQVAGVLVLHKEEHRGKLAYFMAMDKVKFRKTVLPGDVLRLKVELLRLKTKIVVIKGEAFVEDKLVAEGELLFALAEY